MWVRVVPSRNFRPQSLSQSWQTLCRYLLPSTDTIYLQLLTYDWEGGLSPPTWAIHDVTFLRGWLYGSWKGWVTSNWRIESAGMNTITPPNFSLAYINIKHVKQWRFWTWKMCLYWNIAMLGIYAKKNHGGKQYITLLEIHTEMHPIKLSVSLMCPSSTSILHHINHAQEVSQDALREIWIRL